MGFDNTTIIILLVVSVVIIFGLYYLFKREEKYVMPDEGLYKYNYPLMYADEVNGDYEGAIGDFDEHRREWIKHYHPFQPTLAGTNTYQNYIQREYKKLEDANKKKVRFREPIIDHDGGMDTDSKNTPPLRDFRGYEPFQVVEEDRVDEYQRTPKKAGVNFTPEDSMYESIMGDVAVNKRRPYKLPPPPRRPPPRDNRTHEDNPKFVH